METFFQIDGNILLWIQEHIRNPILDPVFEGITHLGDAGIFWILLTAALLCFRKTRKAGIVSAAALIGSLLVNNVCLKNWVGRVRPYEVVDGAEDPDCSACRSLLSFWTFRSLFCIGGGDFSVCTQKMGCAASDPGGADRAFQAVCGGTLSHRCAGRCRNRDFAGDSGKESSGVCYKVQGEEERNGVKC